MDLGQYGVVGVDPFLEKGRTHGEPDAMAPPVVGGDGSGAPGPRPVLVGADPLDGQKDSGRPWLLPRWG